MAGAGGTAAGGRDSGERGQNGDCRDRPEGGGASGTRGAREFVAGVRVGERRSGTVAEVSRQGLAVVLDGFPTHPLGFVGTLDLTWLPRATASDVRVGDRITAEVTSVDQGRGRVWLSKAATDSPELWAFLSSLRPGVPLSGRIASIERFGVFVALDEGPEHPLFPGVGFITYPELAWSPFDAATDVVRVDERVTCEFLQFDTTNGEARLSLRATRPDPFQAFADSARPGRVLRGRVTKLAPFGAFVRVADGVEGLLPHRDPTGTPTTPAVGDELTVVIAALDREHRRLHLGEVPRP
ncbi:S1 RNA-binding domain-containing protein [Streptomyces sp. NPDC097619]|uniref:S1 RNA-binding domain-containing protein n=1 Tax=Streptomyces sp. NPDC097619 TaxID=3157228 RepID=UPI00331CED9B